MTLEELIASARERDFVDVDSIRTLARGAVVLRPSGASEKKLCRSRLGGLPDLPTAIPWPKAFDPNYLVKSRGCSS